MDDRPIGAVVLAAGASRRYGSPKLLAMVDGRTLLQHAIELALNAGLQPVVAVVPAWLARPASWSGEALRWVRNPFPERGMSLSLRLGFGALGDEPTAAVVLLGDQPRLPAATLSAILAARGERPVVAAEAGGVLAPPVLLERTHFPLVEQLAGDIGLRRVLREQAGLVRAVPVRAHPTDVDTPDDLARIVQP